VYTTDVAKPISNLFAELLDGTPESGGYVLNRGDVGLHRSLTRLSASAASTTTQTGSSIAAHVQHLTYALSLLNRWAQGEDPWTSADWSQSWKRTKVNEAEWKDLLHQFQMQATAWMESVQSPREVDTAELTGLLGSAVHVAYHMGAIRQINPSTRGPATA
jgi:hypothetical protein